MLCKGDNFIQFIFYSRGKDFRISFSHLGGLRALTSAPFLALTASAPADIEKHVIASLHLSNPVKVYQPLDRPNIFLSSKKSTGLAVSARGSV